MSYAMGFSSTDVFSSADLLAQGRGFGANDVMTTHDGKQYRYVLSTDTIAAYDVCAVTSAGVASRCTSANVLGGLVGVAQATLSSGYYGWVQTLGQTTVNCLSTCSAGVALYTSATAGSLDDTATSQTKIGGLTILANITAAGPAVGQIATTPFAAI